jgi:proteasome lid subunit RPN8/RPN11
VVANVEGNLEVASEVDIRGGDAADVAWLIANNLPSTSEAWRYKARIGKRSCITVRQH